jgi:hypothetical protein
VCGVCEGTRAWARLGSGLPWRRLTTLLRDALRDGDGGDASRLGDDDATVRASPRLHVRLKQELRHLRHEPHRQPDRRP